MLKRLIKKLLFFCLFLIVCSAVVGLMAAVWGYHYITREMPKLSSVEDYRPPAVSSVFSADGTLIAEFYTERRYPVRLAEIPQMVRDAFLAAEDASFYQHPGIDFISVLRAIKKNLENREMRQGGSTITQQVVKNLLLTSERSLKRKAKEAILSYELEKKLNKDGIFELYLNQIFFGNGAYGIKAAAKIYFHKELSELTLGEAALLAGLPKGPSRYSPLANMSAAKGRQGYVLDQMVNARFITLEEARKALAEPVKVYPADPQNIYAAPYYVGEIRRAFSENPAWRTLDIDSDGLQIHTAVDLNATAMAEIALRRGLREVDKRQGWRGPLAQIPGADRELFVSKFRESIPRELFYDEVMPALVERVSPQGLQVFTGSHTFFVPGKSMQWAKKRLDKEDAVRWIEPLSTIKIGDVTEIVLVPSEASALVVSEEARLAVQQPENAVASFDQTPRLESCMVLLDPATGKVPVLLGGYDYQRSVFNRATQSLRQPGSAFKPIVYLAAIDGYGYTPATIVYDSPRTFKVGDEFWSPANFDEHFLGPISLRLALEKSRNLVSADIVSRIGVDAPIRYAKLLGIQSKIGRNLSISLGSSEVTMLELARAYGVLANHGILFDSTFITKVLTRDGKVLYDFERERVSKAQQVIKEESAFILTNMMKGVVEHGTGYRVKELGRPTAGKTGTSNDQMDAWFVGYTPNWAAGVWVGYDQKHPIGDKETGGRVAAPIWLYFMRNFLKYDDQKMRERLTEEALKEAERLGVEMIAPPEITPPDFEPPEGLEPAWINKTTGALTEAGQPGASLDYFFPGTQPGPSAESGVGSADSYLESPDL